MKSKNKLKKYDDIYSVHHNRIGRNRQIWIKVCGLVGHIVIFFPEQLPLRDCCCIILCEQGVASVEGELFRAYTALPGLCF